MSLPQLSAFALVAVLTLAVCAIGKTGIEAGAALARSSLRMLEVQTRIVTLQMRLAQLSARLATCTVDQIEHTRRAASGLPREDDRDEADASHDSGRSDRGSDRESRRDSDHKADSGRNDGKRHTPRH